MKYLGLVGSCLAGFVLCSTANAATLPSTGQDNRIEWQTQQSFPLAGKTVDMVHSLDGKFVYILNDKGQVQVFSSQGQLHGNIPVGEGIANIDISPQGELLYLINNNTQTFTAVAVSLVVDIDVKGSPFKGPADAPVTITLFTDFECPYCKQIIPLLDQILAKNPTTVKLAFKNLPLRIHKMAEPSAKAALAAHEQGKFWEFHDQLFAQTKLSDDTAKKIATDLKLDLPRFEKDMDSSKIQGKLQKDMLDAQSAGVSGTPTIFINGRTPRQRSVEALQAMIEEELQKSGKK